MKRKKVEIAFISFAFGLAYIFFGLSLLMPDFPLIIRIATGVVALFVGMIFFVVGAYNLPEKLKIELLQI